MFRKEKLIIISSMVDNTIKTLVTNLDVEIYYRLEDFEEDVNLKPMDIVNVLISANDVPYTSHNIKRIKDLLNQPFLNIKHKVFYISTDESIKESFPNIDKLQLILTTDYTAKTILQILRDGSLNDKEKIIVVKSHMIKKNEYDKFMSEQEYTEKVYGSYVNVLDNFETYEPKIKEEIINIQTKNVYVLNIDDYTTSIFLPLLAQNLYIGDTKVIMAEWDNYSKFLTYNCDRYDVGYTFVTIEDLRGNMDAYKEKFENMKSGVVILTSSSVSLTEPQYHSVVKQAMDDLSSVFNYAIYVHNQADYIYTNNYLIPTSTITSKIIHSFKNLPTTINMEQVEFVGIDDSTLEHTTLRYDEYEDLIKYLMHNSDVPVSSYFINSLDLKEGKQIFSTILI